MHERVTRVGGYRRVASYPRNLLKAPGREDRLVGVVSELEISKEGANGVWTPHNEDTAGLKGLVNFVEYL